MKIIERKTLNIEQIEKISQPIIKKREEKQGY